MSQPAEWVVVNSGNGHNFILNVSPKLPSLHICAVGSGVVALWARTVLRRLSVSHATVRTIKGEPLLVSLYGL